MDTNRFVKSEQNIWYVCARATKEGSVYTACLNSNVVAETIESAIGKLNAKYSPSYSNIKILSVSHKGVLDIL